MAGLTLFYAFTEDLAEKVHNLGSDTLKVCLSNTAPVLTNTGFADIVEIAAGNGYTAGGTAATTVSSAQTAGAYKLILDDVTFTASGGSIGPFRYVILYNDTSTGDRLIGYSDYGVNFTITSGQSFQVDFDGSAGVLTLG